MKSPLRYPGGKTRAITQLTDIFNSRFDILHYKTLVSPFCGGCSFEFKLIEILHEQLENIILADLFKPLITFWNQCKYNNDELADVLEDNIGGIDKDYFQSLRQLFVDNYKLSDLNIAVNYFIINRCSFSGSTFSGGFSKEAATKRFTRSSVNSIRRLKNELTNCQFVCQDFVETS